MNNLYVVHLHRIEGSYYFGAFDSIPKLREALEDCFENHKRNPWKDYYLDDIHKIKIGETLNIVVKPVDYFWNIYVCIAYLELNTYYKKTKGL